MELYTHSELHGPIYIRLLMYVRHVKALLAGTEVRKISMVACVSSPNKIDYFGYPKSFINMLSHTVRIFHNISQVHLPFYDFFHAQLS